MGYFKSLDTRIAEAKQVVRLALARDGYEVARMDCVGSSYIVDRINGDIDILAYVPHTQCELGVGCMSFPGQGWAYGGSVGMDGADNWGSWKKHVDGIGEINMLVTTNETYFNAWLTSAEVCRLLHLRGVAVPRDVRVGIHSIIMDDSTADYENERKL